MERAALEDIRKALFPPSNPPVPGPLPTAVPTRPSTMPTTFDPKTPGTPQSLDSVGLKSSAPYQDADGFTEIVGTIIEKHLSYSTATASAFKPQLREYFDLHSVDNEAALSVMTPDLWKEPSIPSVTPGGPPKLLKHVSPPVLAILHKLQIASAHAFEVSRYLSTEVELSALTGWSVAMLHLAHPASSVMGVPAGVSPRLPPGKPKSKDIPSFKVATFNGSILKGDEYIQDTATMFKSYGAHEYLQDENLCNANKEFSQAYASRLRNSIAHNDELKYIVTTHRDEDNCAKLWKVLYDTLMSQKLSLSRECALWKELFDLRCDDLDKFPLFYSEAVSKFHDLGRLKSVAAKDDKFKRVFLHKNIDVEELRHSTKKFLSDLSSDSDKLLDEVKRDYSTLKASEHIKDNAPGSILKGSVRRANDTGSASKQSSEKKTDFKGTYVTPFPKNTGNLIPDEIYKQVRSWYLVMAKREEKSEDDMKFLNNFKFVDRQTKAEEEAAAKAKRHGGGKERNRYRERNRVRRAGYDDYDRDYDRGRRYDDRDRYPPRDRGRRSHSRSRERDSEYGERNRHSRANRSRASMMSGSGNDRYT